MTVHIGTFGVARPQVDATFEWFGALIRVHPDASDLAYTEFLAIAKDIEVGDDGQPTNAGDNQRAAELLDDTLRGQIHPDDHGEFMRLAKANRQQTLDLMMLSQQIISAVSGFPTGPQSASSVGPGGEAQRSPGDLSPRAIRRKEERKQAKRERREAKMAAQPAVVQPTSIHNATIARAARVLSGRPDLQLMVMQRQESLDASA